MKLCTNSEFPSLFSSCRYPEGIPLVTVFVHPSIIEMLDAATDDAIERGSWIDSLSLLPTSFESQDASKILSLCPSVQQALKANKVLIVGESYVFSNGFVKDVYDRMEKETEAFSLPGSSGIMPSVDLHLIKEAKVGHDTSRSTESNETSYESSHKNAMEKGSKKKKGRSGGNPKSGAAESGADDQEDIPNKSKKNQRRGKDTSSQVSDSKSGAKKDGAKTQEENVNVPSEQWV